MKQFYFIICLMFTEMASAQINSGPRITALGNAGVAIKDIWAVQKNQAGISEIEKPTLSLGYENKYFVKEFSVKSAVFILPIKKYVLGFSFQSYGVSSYQESKSAVSLSRNFGPKLSTAIGINYHQLQITQYGATKGFSVDVGAQFIPFKNLCIGAHIANPNASKYDENVEQIIPTHIQFGASYLFSDKILLCSEFDKTLDNEADFKAGLEYSLVKYFALRGGLSFLPFKQYFGFGLKKQDFLFDVAVSVHPILGYSPQIALGYEF